jgi:thiol-disulfide isomerase/thioredoxin
MRLIVALALSFSLITSLYFWQNPSSVQADATQTRPSFRLPDLENKLHDNSEWDGKVVVVNFWATWCPPCVEEIPLFIDLQKEYSKQGLQFIGVAIDDAESVKNFADAVGINYPILLEQKRGKVSQNFGNRMGALPFTVVVDRQGRIVGRQMGGITREEIMQMLQPLLQGDKQPPAAAI